MFEPQSDSRQVSRSLAFQTPKATVFTAVGYQCLLAPQFHAYTLCITYG